MVVHMLRLGFCLVWVAVADVAVEEEVPFALAHDEECREDGSCALNALQLRGAKAHGTRDTHPVVDVELFKAVTQSDVQNELSNIDMYSLAGVLQYLHTNVVGEHVDDWDGTADPRMERRAKDIDVIMGVNAKVRNPDSVIQEVGSVDNFVDFGALAEFVDGMATGPGYNWNFGDIVGVARLHSRQYASIHPYYQFSLSGYCPNLQTSQKRVEDPKKQAYCMTYSGEYDLPQGEKLTGGLCPNGTQPGVVPTGKPGCVYTYTPPADDHVVKLDDLVGITNQTCSGGRKCRDWQDWRMHCSDSRYKKKFNYMSRRHRMASSHHGRRRRHSRRRGSLLQEDAAGAGIIQSHVCVEYDIHKACAKNCNSAACRRVPPHLREVGLPFWKGRCDPLRNAQRAEMLAQVFGMANATSTHKLVREEKTDTCLTQDAEAMCNPDPSTGGMYCSRAWSGVCQPCYIPGTAAPYLENASTPTCPWDVLKSSDYSDPSLHPKCATNLPRDLCCLYSDTCDDAPIASAMEPGQNATEDGFAYATSLQSTDAMMAFLWRAVEEKYNQSVFDIKGASAFAYWQWSQRPIPGMTLDRVLTTAARLVQ